MKYFTYELIAAGNGWGSESRAKQLEASRRFEHAVLAYHRHLDRKGPKVSRTVWDFFRHGNPKNTLHDARLACLNVTDIPNRPLGWSSVSRRRFITKVCLEFLTYDEERLYVFNCSGVQKITTNLFTEEREELGDLYTYELRVPSKGVLAVSFLFATGATIDVECRHLSLRVKGIVTPDSAKHATGAGH